MKLRLAPLALALALLPAEAPLPQQQQAELARSDKVNEAIEAIKSKDASRALAILEPVLAEYEAAHPASGSKVYCAEGQGETLKALFGAALQEQNAVVLGSTWCYALWAKGFALVELGRMYDAVAPLERAAAMMPDTPRFSSELGYVYQMLKNPERSLAAYTAAATAAEKLTDPAQRKYELRRAWFGMGYDLVELGRLDEAEAVLRKCLAMVPDDQKIRNELNYVLERLGKPKVTG